LANLKNGIKTDVAVSTEKHDGLTAYTFCDSYIKTSISTIISHQL